MALVASGFGFIPVYHPSGLDRPTEITPNVVGSRQTYTNGGTLFKFAPVFVDTNGILQPAAAATLNLAGVFLGVEYTNSLDGRRIVSPYIASGTVLVDPVYWLHTDPTIVYEVQAQGAAGAAGSAATSAVVGDNFGLGGAGSGQAIVVGTGTGLSQSFLDLSNSAAQFKVLDHGWEAFSQGSWYDATTNPYPTVRVKVNAGQFA